jgi:hypothetical protein
MEAITPIKAGTPRSRANWTWASCVSLGANDTAIMLRGKR